jgi:RNA polymerase sigma-70 factor, ECF subfamily
MVTGRALSQVDPAHSPAADWDWEALRRQCYGEARRLGRPHAEAEDIAQEALLRAWKMRGSCRNPDRPWAWVQEITRNEAYRLFSRRSMTHELPTDRMPEASTHSGEDAVLTRIDVERALKELSAADRLMLRLRYEEDLTQPNVAVALGLSVANVKVRLHRLRPKLQNTLPAP